MTEARRHGCIVLAVSGIVFLGAVPGPPSLLDDVDAAYAQVARSMLESGDWVTARLNGVPYFDKAPGQVWAMAASFAVFGVSDWAARLPTALAAMTLCWLAWRTGRWAFGATAGLYAGIGLATCCGLFLFTRVRLPDVFVACATLFALDCFLRSREAPVRRARARMAWAGAALGAGLLCKGLVAAVLPAGAVAAFLLASGQWRSPEARARLGLGGAAAAALLVAGPWHLLATLRHPPVLEFGLDSGPRIYRGFFWRYFVNEHLLRYLGQRYPFDYDRVPLAWFWAAHLAWLFPWSGMVAGLRRRGCDGGTRGGATRLLMLCCCGFALLFFSASTTQEYYTLPAYGPAMVLFASFAAERPGRARIASRAAASVYGAAFAAGLAALIATRDLPAAGDISAALTTNPDSYTLSLGHFSDLTLGALAYLRGPLALAVAAFAAGCAGGWLLPARRALASLAAATMLLLQAAHWAMGAFDPYLSSRALAEACLREPPGRIVLDHEYYAFSSVAFYANRPVLLLNGRRNSIEYGANAPGAPDPFLDDRGLAALWEGPDPVYLVTYARDRPRIEGLVGAERVRRLAESGGKVLLASGPASRPN